MQIPLAKIARYPILHVLAAASSFSSCIFLYLHTRSTWLLCGLCSCRSLILCQHLNLGWIRHDHSIQVKDDVLLLETKSRRNGSSERRRRSKDEVPQKNSFLAFRVFLSEIGFVEIRLLALLSVGIIQFQLLVCSYTLQ